MFVVFDLWLLFALFRPLPVLMVTAWVFTAFGSMTVVPPAMSAGINLPVSTVAFLALILRVLRQSRISDVEKTLLDPRGLGLLAAYTGLALVGAFLLPRLMTHVTVYPMSGNAWGGTAMVGPTSSNVTQALYTAISTGTALAYALVAGRPEMWTAVRSSSVWGASVLVATGIVDMVLGAAGQSALLDGFRLAQYAYLVDVEVANLRRVVGLMPEASSFGVSCVFWCGTLLFTRDFFPARQRVMLVAPLVVATAVLAVLSTSTTAYLGLSVIGAVFGVDVIWRLVAGGTPQAQIRAGVELAIATLLGCAVALYVLLNREMSDAVWTIFESVVLEKSNSSSFAERNAWTTVGLEAFRSSLGLGVGVGSVRTSNLFVNILASTGVIGAGLFAAFLVVFFTARPADRSPPLRALVGGTKRATLPVLAGAAVAGTTPDFGPVLGAAFGLVIGAALRRDAIPRRSPRSSRPSRGLRFPSTPSSP